MTTTELIELLKKYERGGATGRPREVMFEVGDRIIDTDSIEVTGLGDGLMSELYLSLPSAEPEIIRCRDCKYWRQQTNYQGVPLSFGFCESDDMWQSLYGETCEVSHIDTYDDFYCGYAKRRTDGRRCK